MNYFDIQEQIENVRVNISLADDVDDLRQALLLLLELIRALNEKDAPQ